MVLSPGTFWITSAKLEFSQQKTFKLWYRSSLTSLYQLAVLVCLFLDSITVEENTSKYNFIFWYHLYSEIETIVIQENSFI